MNFKQALKTKYYAQGFSATPIHLLAAATSGFSMQEIDLSYTSFLFRYKKEYAIMHYMVDDLERLSKILEKRHKQEKVS